MSVVKLPAVYMRGGTSKGVFFRAEHLPADPRQRDRLLLQVIGSPDPYGRQIDGMGAEAVQRDGACAVTRVMMSRSARRLMEGWVYVPTSHQD
jgi:2-methylaconitate cis-trans-isomerase PrpF